MLHPKVGSRNKPITPSGEVLINTSAQNRLLFTKQSFSNQDVENVILST